MVFETVMAKTQMAAMNVAGKIAEANIIMGAPNNQPAQGQQAAQTNPGGWDINNVFDNTGDLLRTIGSGLMIIIGIVMIIVGIFKIAQGMISHGKTQVNWVINILLIVVGALFCAGGAIFSGVLTAENNGVGSAIANTLQGLGNDGGNANNP